MRLFSLRLSFVLVSRLSHCDQASVYIYIDKSHMTTNLLVYAGLSSNFLERALRLNAPEHSTTIEIAKLGQKHIT